MPVERKDFDHVTQKENTVVVVEILTDGYADEVIQAFHQLSWVLGVKWVDEDTVHVVIRSKDCERASNIVDYFGLAINKKRNVNDPKLRIKGYKVQYGNTIHIW